ncbi:hypothetical protein BGW80DRAFT_1489460 [Lactifluus volemus]|nr:hypothetical protein BGW80DRAFT_1489460 [Lactifluus volemus]
MGQGPISYLARLFCLSIGTDLRLVRPAEDSQFPKRADANNAVCLVDLSANAAATSGKDLDIVITMILKGCLALVGASDACNRRYRGITPSTPLPQLPPPPQHSNVPPVHAPITIPPQPLPRTRMCPLVFLTQRTHVLICAPPPLPCLVHIHVPGPSPGWSLHFDWRFRKHKTFLFFTFGILQRREALMSARVQMNRAAFEQDTNIIAGMTKDQLVVAQKEEEENRPRSFRLSMI